MDINGQDYFVVCTTSNPLKGKAVKAGLENRFCADNEVIMIKEGEGDYTLYKICVLSENITEEYKEYMRGYTQHILRMIEKAMSEKHFGHMSQSQYKKFLKFMGVEL